MLFFARYVHEHREVHAFPDEWISATFATVTFWNGILAISAGIISNFTVENMDFGPTAPFVVACLPLLFCGLLVQMTWGENYGTR